MLYSVSDQWKCDELSCMKLWLKKQRHISFSEQLTYLDTDVVSGMKGSKLKLTRIYV